MAALSPLARAGCLLILFLPGSLHAETANTDDLRLEKATAGIAGIMLGCDGNDHGINRLNRLVKKSPKLRALGEEIAEAMNLGMKYNTVYFDESPTYMSCDEWRNDGGRQKGEVIFDGFMNVMEQLYGP